MIKSWRNSFVTACKICRWITKEEENNSFLVIHIGTSETYQLLQNHGRVDFFASSKVFFFFVKIWVSFENGDLSRKIDCSSWKVVRILSRVFRRFRSIISLVSFRDSVIFPKKIKLGIFDHQSLSTWLIRNSKKLSFLQSSNYSNIFLIVNFTCSKCLSS